MENKKYWILRDKVKKTVFHIRKLIFGIQQRIYNERTTLSFTWLIAKTLLKQVLSSATIAVLLYVGDILISTYIIGLEINGVLLNDVLIGGMGIAGVILGLYCSNMVSIYSARYVNTPSSLAELYQRDIITNKCIRQIIGYIILDLILIVENISGVKLLIVTIVVMFILTARLIITYSLAGNRTYLLSDTYKIADSIYRSINSNIRKTSKSGFITKDISFQNHYQKTCFRNISVLEDIARYNQDNPSNQNEAMMKFMERNIQLVITYWESKPAIYYDSMWFRQQVTYPQWHTAQDHEIQVALSTGTSLRISQRKNTEWFEEEIEKVNNVCLSKLCKEKNIHSIEKFLTNISVLADHATKGNSLNQMLKYAESLQEKVLPISGQVYNEDNDTNGDIIAAIAESLSLIYISIIVGINRYLADMNLEDILTEAKKVTSYNEVDFSKYEYLNFPIAEKQYNQISAEITIEQKRITPDWAIEQTISKVIFDKLVSYVNIVDKIFNEDFLRVGTYFLENKIPFAALIAFTRFPELSLKIDLTIEFLEKIIPELLKKHVEPSIVWNDNPLQEFIVKKAKTMELIPEYWLKCSGSFALQHWKDREDYPDLLGFCYNHLCEYLLKALENNDIEKFKKGYNDYFNIMLFYQEYVRNDVIKIKETHMANRVFHVFTAPLIDYAIISGLAIIWGEFSEEKQWREYIKAVLKKYVDNNENAIEVLKQSVKLASHRKNSLMGIGNRDVLHTDWEMRISRAIREKGFYKSEYCKFGMETIKTDSKLLKAFIGASFDLSGLDNSEEIFFIDCVNKYLLNDEKYESRFGWEDEENE